MSGTTSLYQSPTLTDNQLRTLEVCLSATTNSQYTLTMHDTFGDGWSDGAYIEIQTINDNTILKVFMSERFDETVQFSLYSPINKGAVWKFSNTFANDWKNLNYVDSAWIEVTTGTSTVSSTGTQYFREQFSGLTGMAAIEAAFNYRFGIVAYINGVEIYRDNMPTGDIQDSTSSSGSYQSLTYHGIIRPSTVAETSQSVMAVELHFQTSGFQQNVDFNGYLTFMAKYNSTTNCFIVPNDVAASSTTFTDSYKAFSWTRNTYTYLSASSLPGIIFAEFSGVSYPMVNGVRIWPYTSTSMTPSSFDVSGGSSVSGTEWTSVVNPSDVLYDASVWKEWVNIGTPSVYRAMRVTVNSVLSTTVYIYALQFLVCNNPPTTTIPYSQTPYQFYTLYSSVNINPNVFGVSGCQASPALPTGLSIDSSSCIITGSASVSSSQTTYTITAQTGTQTLTGTVTMSFTDCTGTMIRILRTYKSSASYEGFRIRNTANDDILLEVMTGHTNPDNTDVVSYLCVTVDRFDVTLYCTNLYWMSDSYLYVYGMLPDGQEELLLKTRYDSYLALDTTHYLRRHAIHSVEQWYYKMGEVPENWYNAETTGWTQAAKGSFPESSNQIQLYKKTFTLSSLSEVSGVILSIRYRYGCIAYLNGHEVWRNGVTGTLSTSSIAENAYSDLLYRVVTLPGRSVPTSTSETSVSYLQQGSNTIAFAIVAISATTQKASLFDATVRLMTNEPESHIWEFTSTESGMYGTAANVFSKYYSNSIYYYSCGDNSMIVTLNNDRREWISSVQIQNYYYSNSDGVKQFNLYARNGDGNWVELKAVTGLTYSMAGQKRRIYFANNTPYNQFKFENFGSGSTTSCGWRAQSLDLFADNVLVESSLTYTSTSAYKDIEMSELIPEGTGFYDFQITPNLPTGLVIDSQNGWISGTPTVESPSSTYQVTASKITGGTTTVSFTLEVVICTNGRSLMTARFRADSFASENSWKLFQGRTTSGTPLQSVTKFPVSSAYYYVDFCLEDGIYTLQGADSYGDGWSVNSGLTLTADLGAMELDIMEIRSSATKPVYASVAFSTFFPFQIEYTEWKVYQSVEAVAADWNTVTFNDAAWQTAKAAMIPSTEAVTTYIRKSFTMSGISDYQVLNVRVKYAGGVAAYFNGNLVARFNLAEEFEATTESIAVHDSTLFSKFHVILATANIQEGTNVFAFEIHRPIGVSSSDPIVFDATGVFGVEDCSTVLDSYSSLTSTSPNYGTIDYIMDLDPYTTGEFANSVGTYIEWTVENLLGSKWNSFNIVGSSTVSGWGFDIYGYFDADTSAANRITVYSNSNIEILDRSKPQLAVPVALASFRKYRWEVTVTSYSTTSIGTIHSAYCQATGSVCPAIGNYPSVGEGQISAAGCPDGYRGYSYRTCSGGVLSDIQTDMCTHKLPAMVRYRSSRFTFVMGTSVTTATPTYRNIVTRWYIDTGVSLPAGLTLNESTGEITGVPTAVQSLTTFTVYAENPTGAASTTISIQVRKGTCVAEGLFPVTDVGEVAVYECSSQGSYVGTQKRSCVLGETDGEWKDASGFCMSIATIVILVVVAIVIVAIIVFVLMRMGRKTKSVGGVKGKKTSKTVPKKSDKKTTKSVKV